MKKIKIGQIGIGHNHGVEKMRTVRKFPEIFEVVGYAEENERWIEKRGAIKGYDGLPRLSVEEVIERSDAVLIESDVWDLTKYAKMCVDAGKHIHLDKPASGTLEEYKYVLDTAKEKNLVVQLGYMYRYNPAVLKLFEMVKNGELGEISAIHAEMSIVHSDKYRTWLRNFQGGDLYIFGSHLIDLIVALMGEPKKVLSSVVSSDTNGVESPDLTAAILEYDHALVRIFSSSVEWDGWARRCFSVSGSKGTAHIQPLEDPCRMTFAPQFEGARAGVEKAQPVYLPERPGVGRYDDMMQDFCAYIKGTKQNPYTYEHDYLVQKVLDEVVGGIRFYGKNID